jgi:hypothetical protein
VVKILALGLVCSNLFLAGCCSSGLWLNRPADQVVILTGPPAHSYFQVGTVSSPGGPHTIPEDNYHHLQREAACLGASAVILLDSGSAEEPDFWQYPHTGIAIVYATSSL